MSFPREKIYRAVCEDIPFKMDIVDLIEKEWNEAIKGYQEREDNFQDTIAIQSKMIVQMEGSISDMNDQIRAKNKLIHDFEFTICSSSRHVPDKLLAEKMKREG